METKTIINDTHNAAVVTSLHIGYSYILRTLLKMTPPSLAKLDVSDGGKFVLVIGSSSKTKNWMIKMKYIPAVMDKKSMYTI